jgi:hypothetical protein
MSGRFSKMLILAGVLALAASSLSAGPALAERGSGSTSTYSATVSASPNPAAAGGTKVYITGCGYKNDTPVEVRIKHATYTESYMVGVWTATGCLNPTPFYTREAGSYTIEAWQRNSPTVSLMASTALPVQ